MGKPDHPQSQCTARRGGSLQKILECSITNLLSWSKSSLIKNTLASSGPVSKENKNILQSSTFTTSLLEEDLKLKEEVDDVRLDEISSDNACNVNRKRLKSQEKFFSEKVGKHCKARGESINRPCEALNQTSSRTFRGLTAETLTESAASIDTLESSDIKNEPTFNIEETEVVKEEESHTDVDPDEAFQSIVDYNAQHGGIVKKIESISNKNISPEIQSYTPSKSKQLEKKSVSSSNFGLKPVKPPVLLPDSSNSNDNCRPTTVELLDQRTVVQYRLKDEKDVHSETESQYSQSSEPKPSIRISTTIFEKEHTPMSVLEADMDIDDVDMYIQMDPTDDVVSPNHEDSSESEYERFRDLTLTQYLHSREFKGPSNLSRSSNKFRIFSSSDETDSEEESDAEETLRLLSRTRSTNKCTIYSSSDTEDNLTGGRFAYPSFFGQVSTNTTKNTIGNGRHLEGNFSLKKCKNSSSTDEDSEEGSNQSSRIEELQSLKISDKNIKNCVLKLPTGSSLLQKLQDLSKFVTTVTPYTPRGRHQNSNYYSSQTSSQAQATAFANRMKSTSRENKSIIETQVKQKGIPTLSFDSDSDQSKKSDTSSSFSSSSSDGKESESKQRTDSCLIDLSDLNDNEEVAKLVDVSSKEGSHQSIKVNQNQNLNKTKRGNAEKLRCRPARLRNYSYRKQVWECPLCKSVLKYGSRFLHMHLKHSDTRPYMCSQCSFKSSNTYVIKKHRLRHRCKRDGNNGKYKCNLCCKTFCYKETLRRHKLRFHEKKLFCVSCAFCAKSFLNTHELGRHYQSDHPGKHCFKCQLCENEFKSTSALNLHKREKHYNDKPFKCDQCDFVFSRKDKLIGHKRRHLKTRIENRKCPHIKPKLKGPRTLNNCEKCGPVCEVCSYIFKSKKLFFSHTHINFCGKCVLKFRDQVAYKLHIAYHEPEATIKHRCEICKFGFLQIKNLNIHASRMHRLKLIPLKYTCNICSKEFGSHNLLSIHVKTHATRRKFQCPWCNDSFISITLLYYHLQRKHTMERPYRCQDCKKDFVKQGDLNRHIKSHKNIKAFDCHICDLKLVSNRNLKLHLATHTTKKQYECQKCGIGFRQKCYLKLHQQLHKPDGKQYPCGFCSRSYMKAQGLQEHLVAEHKFNYFRTCQNCKKNFVTITGLKNHVRNSNCGKRMGSSSSNKRLR